MHVCTKTIDACTATDSVIQLFVYLTAWIKKMDDRKGESEQTKHASESTEKKN